jgi:hypothetical protein
MVRNIEQINENFLSNSAPTSARNSAPTSARNSAPQIWIYISDDVPENYVNKYRELGGANLRLIPCTGTGRLMTERFFAIDEPDTWCMIVRDADSRFTPRDIKIIKEFTQESSHYSLYTIRDHFWHNCPIMGGQWGLKKTNSLEINLRQLYERMKQEYAWRTNTVTVTVDSYNMDEQFLRYYVYPIFGKRQDMIAYSSVNYTFDGTETIERIITEQNTADFCGNVFDFDETGNEYTCFKYF